MIGGPAIPDVGAYHLNQNKIKQQPVQVNLDTAIDTIRNMKYYKKITGPTLFSDQMDEELPGWMFLCNSLFAPHLEDRYHQVIKSY